MCSGVAHGQRAGVPAARRHWRPKCASFDPFLPLTLPLAAYGSSTELVLTFGDGVHVFSLDPGVGEFIQTRRNVRIPAAPQRIYRCGARARVGRPPVLSQAPSAGAEFTPSLLFALPRAV